MPWIISVFLGGLLRIVSSAVGRVLLALGFGFVEYLGISALVDSVKAEAMSLLNVAGSSMLVDWLGFFRVDQHLSIILSAIGVKMMLSALTGGRVRRLVQK